MIASVDFKPLASGRKTRRTCIATWRVHSPQRFVPSEISTNPTNFKHIATAIDNLSRANSFSPRGDLITTLFAGIKRQEKWRKTGYEHTVCT